MTRIERLRIELAQELAKAEQAVCFGCARIFTPKDRRRATTKRAWCQKCGRAAAVRQAKRDYRARLRA